MISVCLFLWLMALGGTNSRASVPWADVRDAVMKLICVATVPLADGRQTQMIVVGEPSACDSAEPETPLARAVRAAFEDAKFLLGSVHPEGDFHSQAPEEDPVSLLRKAREAYLGSEEFLRILLPRLRAALASEGLQCGKCPEFEPRPVRHVAWVDFFPYLAAHVWPDSVITPKGPDGKPAGKPEYSFHICGGLNGIAEMKDPDPALVRAGFVAAFRTDEVHTRGIEHFSAILKDPAFVALEDDGARTRYLRTRLRERLVQDEAMREGTCRTLARYHDDLALDVEGCEDVRKTGP